MWVFQPPRSYHDSHTVLQYHVIFDAEAEAHSDHSEDEYDAPIPEEDEEAEEEEAGDDFHARTSDNEHNTTHDDSWNCIIPVY